MSNKFILIPFLLIGLANMLAGQNHYNIRLDPMQANVPNQSCFNIQLAAADGTNLNLAGQNYRLFYDATLLEIEQSQISYLLPSNQYHNLTVKNFTGENDQGIGYLPFDQRIGFLNISIDLLDYKTGGQVLSANGEWTNTCQVCFKKKSAASNTQGKIIWARPDLTQDYATGFVEIAEWKDQNITQPALATTYEDLSFSTSNTFLQWEESPLLFPVPTKDYLWIEQTAEQDTQIQIWNIQGSLVHTDKIPVGTPSYQLDLRSFPAGMYQVRLTKNQRQFSQLIEKINH